MKHRLLIILSVLNMMFGLLPANNVGAESDITYIERYADGTQEEMNVPDDASVYDGRSSLSSGWYVIDQNMTVNDRIEIHGNVSLVLVDGVVFNAGKGIRVAQGNTLIIYGQSRDSGKLMAHGDKYDAGIGSNDSDQSYETSAGTIIIQGGTINVTGGSEAAGIGGGNESDGGEIYIYGGNVTANGGRFAAGIGGGDEGNSGKITIYGGTVTAKGSEGGSGIGGGTDGNGETITINGGTIQANGYNWGAGIGGGQNGEDRPIILEMNIK